jgi:hypothetical protein
MWCVVKFSFITYLLTTEHFNLRILLCLVLNVFDIFVFEKIVACHWYTAVFHPSGF